MVLPGFVDSHTHLVFAGDRSNEFEMRLAGKTYQDIAKAGGGISASCQATRLQSKNDLFKSALARVNNFLKQGVTTVEIKTGYGLSLEAEKKCLDVIEGLKKKSRATIKATYLAAHSVPPEFKGRQGEYVETLAKEWLPLLKKKIDYVDMFIDDGYFTVEDARVLLTEAMKIKIPSKLHADELKLSGGSRIAVEYGALSCDHLLCVTKTEAQLIAKSETTATLLPATAFFLKKSYAPARMLLDAGARVALATDFNPGTAPSQDIALVGALAALEMKMRIDEVIVSLTLNGAYALGMETRKGACLPGFDADFQIVESQSPAGLFYNFGQRFNLPEVYCSGRPV